MRGTLHLVAADDLRWLLSLLGPVFVRKSQRRYAQLGLSEQICATAMTAIRDILSEHWPLPRAELASRLASRGIPTAGQAAYHLLRRAALEGVICYGPDRDGQETFVLIEDWVDAGPEVEEDAARGELARRYLAAYGPAGPEDFAAWLGLPLHEARAAFDAIADQLREVEADGLSLRMLESHAAWLDDPDVSGSGVQLLPAFDTLLLGYRDRELIVPPPYAKRVNAGGGLIRPTVLVDGHVAGTWKIERDKDSLAILVEPFEPFDAVVMPALENEVEDVARFLEQDAQLRVENS
jgi:hypothetical protein